MRASRWDQVAEWLKNKPPLRGAELGVKEGRFISYLLSKYPKLIMYAIDPWEDQPEGSETYIGWDWKDIYKLYRVNVSPYYDRVIEYKDYSYNVTGEVVNGSLDFVFIDAQHDYDSVKRDIELWRPKIKPGGLLCGHDYQPKFKGLIQAVNECVDNPVLGGNDTWAKWI